MFPLATPNPTEPQNTASKLMIPVGVYTALNGAFCVSDGKFLIKDRKTPSPNKPDKYLIHIGGKIGFKYISSLFEQESTSSMQVFRFDYGSQIYLLTLENEKVEIEVIEL
jgi:hypothetical protein